MQRVTFEPSNGRRRRETCVTVTVMTSCDPVGAALADDPRPRRPLSVPRPRRPQGFRCVAYTLLAYPPRSTLARLYNGPKRVTLLTFSPTLPIHRLKVLAYGY